jgi:hypothetical protein
VVLALLGLFVLAVGGAILLQVTEPSDPVPSVMENSVPGRLIDAGFGTIAAQAGELGVVAPDTATVTPLSSYAEIDTSESLTGLPLVAAARGSLWVLVRSGASTSELVQIDPATDTIVQRKDVPISSPKFLVAADGALWANSTGGGPGFVLQIARIDLDDLAVQTIDEGTEGGLADLAATDGSRLWVKITPAQQGEATIRTFEFSDGSVRGSDDPLLRAESVQEMVATDGGLLMALVGDYGVALRHSSGGPDGELAPLPLDGIDDLAVSDGSIWVVGYRGADRKVLRLDALRQVVGSTTVDDQAAAVLGVDQTTARVLSPGRPELVDITL